jgi:hypothetical protein
VSASPPTQSEGTRRERLFGGYEPGARFPARRSLTVAAWSAVALCAAVVFELTCRVEDWVMYRMPIASPYESIEDLLVHDADGVHGRPNAQFEKWVMNNLGTRGPDAPLVPAVGSIRVITVGASETFGLRESPGREYPRQLEDSLNARRGGLGCPQRGADAPRFEVLNAAFAGMTVPTIDQDIRNRLRRLRPSIILAYVSPSAYLEEQRPVAAKPDSARTVLPPPALRALRPRALERLRDQLKGMMPQGMLTLIRRGVIAAANREHSDESRFTAIPPERASALDADLRTLVGTIRAIGATPVLMTHANLFAGRALRDSAQLFAWARFYPRATGPTLIAFDSLARIVTARVARDSNVVLSDAAERLARAPESAFADYVHFTDVGAAIVASVAADGVISAARAVDCDRR